MYFAYAWPKVLASGTHHRGDDPVVALELDAGLGCLAVVFASSVEIWSTGQHRRLVGRHARDAEAVAEEGAYLAARWRGGGHARLAVVAAGGRARLFDVVWPNASPSDSNRVDPNALPERCELILRATLTVGPGSIVLPVMPNPADDDRHTEGGGHHRRTGSLGPMLSPVNEHAAAPLNDGVCLSIAGDHRVMLLGTSTGHIVQCSWDGGDDRGDGVDVLSRGDPCAVNGGDHMDGEHSIEHSQHRWTGAVTRMDYSYEMRAAVAVMSSGRCALLRISGGDTEESGDTDTNVAERLRLDRWLGDGDAACAALSPAPSSRTVAVGASNGVVRLYRVDFEGDTSSVDAPPTLLRTLSLADWGYGVSDTGGCADVGWAADGEAVCVGWWKKGVATWSANGCRLMCTLPQGGGTAGCHVPDTIPGSDGSVVSSPATQEAGLSPRHFAGGRPETLARRRTRDAGDGGTARLAWTADGYGLFAASASGGGDVDGEGVTHGEGATPTGLAGTKGRLREFSFAAASPRHHLGRGGRTHLLRAPDRIIALDAGDGDGDGDDTGMASATGMMDEPGVNGSARHIMIPHAYASPNWPLRLLAESGDGRDVAAAGSKGLVLLDTKTGKWRFFGDVSHEREFVATGLAWLDGGVVAVSARLTGTGGTGGGSWFDWSGSRSNYTEEERHVLRVYPRNHLSATSVLLEHELTGEPVAMSALGRVLLGATRAESEDGGLRIDVFEVTLNRGTASLRSVRRVTLRDSKVRGPMELALLPSMPPRPDSTSPAATRAQASALRSPKVGLLGPPPEPPPPPIPAHCMMLRRDGGILSLIDLGSDGVQGETCERRLADGVERFWIASGDATQAPNCDADARWSWWTYGAEGTRVWYVPSTGVPSSPAPSHGGGGDSVAFTDPELEFDKEAYPLGVVLGGSAPLIVGCTQRLAFTGCTAQPCFEPTPKAQPILPCMLRHLLRVGERGAAIGVARRCAGKPRFTHSLEWLLFSALDRHVGPSSVSNKNDPVKASTAEKALGDAVSLCREFSEYAEVVVSVARKTDSAEWPELFRFAGDPSLLQANALADGQLRTAACYLLVVDKLVSAVVGAKAAGDVLRAALAGGRYGLVGELVRFLARPAVEEAAGRAAARSAEKKRRGGSSSDDGDVGIVSGLFKWLGAAPEPEKDPKEKEVPAAPLPRRSLDEEFIGTPKGVEHVSGARGGVIAVLPPNLRRALRDHASKLAAAVDLAALSAFTRETDFDLGAFFQRELADFPDGGAARLVDFPKALALAADSLRRHESRAGGGRSEVAAMRAGIDAMLVKMVSAGCVEWSLVTATLTRRVEVLSNIFDGRDEVMSAWRVAVERCAAAASARGDIAHAAFLQSLRDEVCGHSNS
jgi:hypothetical protein